MTTTTASNHAAKFYWPLYPVAVIYCRSFRETLMFDPFWTFGPMMIDYSAGRTAAEANTKANSAEMRVRELEHRVERLALACNAMWGLLRSQTGLTDQQLQAKIQQIDTAEGAGPRNMIKCANCGRHVSPRRGKCMYCGSACAQASVFEE